jgi:transcriptional regulator with XRE-family HTH domain
LQYASGTWSNSNTAGTVSDKKPTPDLLRLLKQAPAAPKRDELQALMGAIEEFLTDDERKRRVGARLRDLRQHSPYTQEAIAEHIGVTLRAYQKMEQTGGMSYPNRVKLADLFKVDIGVLYDEPATEVITLDDRLARLEHAVSRLENIEQQLNHVLANQQVALDLLRAAQDDPAVHAAMVQVLEEAVQRPSQEAPGHEPGSHANAT